MSYTDDIPEKKLSNYEVITDFNDHFNKLSDPYKAPFNTLYSLEFNDKIIESDVMFFGSYDFDLRFTNCYFKKSFTLATCQFKKSFTISNCFFDKDISSMLGATIHGKFIITSTLVNSVLFTDGNFAFCLWSFSDCDNCTIAGGNFTELKIVVEDKGINNFYIFGNELSGFINVSGAENLITNFTLQNYSTKLNLTIEDTFVTKFNISRYRNENGLRLSNISSKGVDTEFAISQSFLGKTEFYLIDFSKFSSLRIVDTHIVDCAFINVIWPPKILPLKGSLEDDSLCQVQLLDRINQIESRRLNFLNRNKILNNYDIVNYYGKQRETYRQLKYAFNKQGDFVNEGKFHSYELLAFDKTINWKNSFWTKVVIKFSHYLSDFGQSIRKPLFGLLIGHFILFLILVLFNVLFPLHFSITNANFEGFWFGVNQYFRLINPLRKAEETFFGGWIIIDIFMRIWSSYMIYNIIRATRRFIK